MGPWYYGLNMVKFLHLNTNPELDFANHYFEENRGMGFS
jgi:hypothetical protein